MSIVIQALRGVCTGQHFRTKKAAQAGNVVFHDAYGYFMRVQECRTCGGWKLGQPRRRRANAP